MAAALGEPDWADAAAATAGARVEAPSPTPRYGELAATGLRLVELLADAGRWDEAREQSAHMADYFTAVRRKLHPVAAVGFQGLCDAARARDREEVDEHVSFLREILGG